MKARDLKPEQAKYLRKISKTQSFSKSGIYKRDEVRNLLGFNNDIQNRNIGDVVDIENFLLADGFISNTGNEGLFQINQKGIEYLTWKKYEWLISKREWLLKNIKNKHTTNVLEAISLFFAFVLLDRFALHFYEKNKVFNLFEDIFRYSQYIPLKVFFTVLVFILFFRSPRTRLMKWDFLIILIYFYFRSGGSKWYFWPLYNIDSHIIRYIDCITLYYGLMLINFIILKKLGDKKSLNKDVSWLTLDLPLKEMSDELKKPIEELDLLGRSIFAAQMAEEIKIMKPYKAFAIGINGPWGSGKTSLIDLIIDKVIKDNYGRNTIIVEFFPWLSKDTESLISNFLSLLEKKFECNTALADEFNAYSKAIGAIEKKFFETEFTSLLSNERSDIRIRYETIAKEINNENKLLLIKIDDLDRLTKSEIIDTLRLIRIIANFPNTIYIVGYDKEYLTSAIKSSLTEHHPDKYIDKVFNVEFKMPEIQDGMLLERLKISIVRQLEVLKNRGKIPLNQFTAIERFFEGYSFNGLKYFIANERDIIRFTNSLILRYLSIKEDIDFNDFFLLELINYRHPEIYLEIYSNKESLTY